MKVALLSFHNASNYGAALQAYALQKVIEAEGIECPYIDYQNFHRAHAYDMAYHIKDSLRKKNFKAAIAYILGYPFIELRNRNFRDFFKKNLKVTNRVYSSSAEAKELNGIYDKFIVGSDQVWNNVNNGQDFAFLLDFVDDDKKKISYSSSFGLSEIPANLVSDYKKNLEKIYYLSVREEIGVRIVKNLTGRIAKLVVDPVFLVPFDDWKRLTHDISEKFIFNYNNNDGLFNEFCNKFGYCDFGKVYKLSRSTTIPDLFNPSVRVKYFMHPLEFLSVINSSELIFTDSFHCIAFAIIFRKDFVVALTNNYGKDERLVNILKEFGLENRIFTDKMTKADISTPIDYDSVYAKLLPFISESKKFLFNSIYTV